MLEGGLSVGFDFGGLLKYLQSNYFNKPPIRKERGCSGRWIGLLNRVLYQGGVAFFVVIALFVIVGVV